MISINIWLLIIAMMFGVVLCAFLGFFVYQWYVIRKNLFNNWGYFFKHIAKTRGTQSKFYQKFYTTLLNTSNSEIKPLIKNALSNEDEFYNFLMLLSLRPSSTYIYNLDTQVNNLLGNVINIDAIDKVKPTIDDMQIFLPLVWILTHQHTIFRHQQFSIDTYSNTHYNRLLHLTGLDKFTQKNILPIINLNIINNDFQNFVNINQYTAAIDNGNQINIQSPTSQQNDHANRHLVEGNAIESNHHLSATDNATESNHHLSATDNVIESNYHLSSTEESIADNIASESIKKEEQTQIFGTVKQMQNNSADHSSSTSTIIETDAEQSMFGTVNQLEKGASEAPVFGTTQVIENDQKPTHKNKQKENTPHNTDEPNHEKQERKKRIEQYEKETKQIEATINKATKLLNKIYRKYNSIFSSGMQLSTNHNLEEIESAIGIRYQMPKDPQIDIEDPSECIAAYNKHQSEEKYNRVLITANQLLAEYKTLKLNTQCEVQQLSLQEIEQALDDLS